MYPQEPQSDLECEKCIDFDTDLDKEPCQSCNCVDCGDKQNWKENEASHDGHGQVGCKNCKGSGEDLHR